MIPEAGTLGWTPYLHLGGHGSWTTVNDVVGAALVVIALATNYYT
jgi:hypothetical protein